MGLIKYLYLFIFLFVLFFPSYALDDVTKPLLNFVSPTKANNSYVTNNWTEINQTIIEENLRNYTFNWNGTNYGVYDDSLVGYWNFNYNTQIGESNTTVVDNSLYGNNGTMTNMNQGIDNGSSGWTSSGKFGNALLFNGKETEPISHVYVRITHTNNSISNELDLVNAEEASWFMWVKPNKNLTDLGSLWDSYVLFKPKNTFVLGWSGWSHDGWECNVWNQSNSSIVAKVWYTYPQVANKWEYIGCTFNGTSLKLYLNGIEVASNNTIPNYTLQKSTFDAINTEFYDLFIGSKNQEANWNVTFNGTIDEVRIYNRSLSADEIAFQYQSEFQKYNQTEWRFYNNISKLTDGTYFFNGWANDTAGNINQSEIIYFTVDTTLPTYSLNSTNSTVAGSEVLHSLYWQDSVGLSGYIFSFKDDNGWSYSNTNHNITEDTAQQGIEWDGTNWWMLSNNGTSANVYKYSSDWTYLEEYYELGFAGNFVDLNWNGTHWHVMEKSNGANVTIYNSTWNRLTNYFIDTPDLQNNNVGGFDWNGTNWVTTNSVGKAWVYNSTWNNISNSSINLQGGSGKGMRWKSPYWYATDIVDRKVYQYTSGLSYTGKFWSISGEVDYGSSGIEYNNDTNNWYLIDQDTDKVFVYNNTGTIFLNDTWISFSGTGNWSNVTKSITSDIGANISWRIYANDTYNNWNISDIYSYITTSLDDTLSPTYSLNSTNSTFAGADIVHSLYWQDTALAGYIFSFDNGTGTFVNDSFAEMTGTGNWSNVSKSVNATVGATIKWKVYANDTLNNWNVSDIYTYNTTSSTTANFTNETLEDSVVIGEYQRVFSNATILNNGTVNYTIPYDLNIVNTSTISVTSNNGTEITYTLSGVYINFTGETTNDPYKIQYKIKPTSEITVAQGGDCPSGYTSYTTYCENIETETSYVRYSYVEYLNISHNITESYNLSYVVGNTRYRYISNGYSFNLTENMSSIGMSYSLSESQIYKYINTTHTSGVSLSTGTHSIYFDYRVPRAVISGGQSPSGTSVSMGMWDVYHKLDNISASSKEYSIRIENRQNKKITIYITTKDLGNFYPELKEIDIEPQTEKIIKFHQLNLFYSNYIGKIVLIDNYGNKKEVMLNIIGSTSDNDKLKYNNVFLMNTLKKLNAPFLGWIAPKTVFGNNIYIPIWLVSLIISLIVIKTIYITKYILTFTNINRFLRYSIISVVFLILLLFLTLFV